MEKKEKTRYQKAFLIIFAMFLILFGLLVFYIMWQMATTKISGEADCEIKNLDYQLVNRPVTCVSIIETNETSLCAIPRDIHCKGAIQDFPIAKAIIEASQ